MRSPATTTPSPAINPSQAGSAATDTVAGPNDTTTGRSTISGTATGRVAKDSNIIDGVDGPASCHLRRRSSSIAGAFRRRRR